MSDADIVKEFLVESYENLDRLDQDLIALEKDPGNRETLASVFRTIHTIKGTSGFLAFNRLEAVTHVGENLLVRLRDGLLALSPEITTALLAMVDAVRQMLASIEATGNEGERNDQELIAALTRLLQTKTEAAPAAEPTPEKKEAQPNRAPQPVPNIGDILVSRGLAQTSELDEAVEQQDAGDPRHVGEILVEKGAVKPQDVIDALNIQQQARGQSASDSTIRVDVNQLDRLMNRVGELVLLRNQIVQYTNSTEDSELLGTSQRLNLLTTELQESVMKTRMQPIGNIWSKFPRTVRDVALGCGKQVRIEMEGKETELDKTIIEAIKDPLTHLVRNAVDHGIEPPEARQAAGKEPEGRLFLRAFHEGGQVNIEITDDGAGLDFEKIRNKAVQKALVTADQAARMTEREITNLIFLPGFSTAERVTNVSGRGVGMDVVRTNIEKIGGAVDVQSKPGQGSTVRMKIPLTLAIIPALIVTTAGDRYAIPQVSLLELVRLEGEQVRKGIELVNGAPVHRLRGRLLPLVYLKRELSANANASGAAAAHAVSGAKAELDFAQAREKHQQWLVRLRQVLDGKLAMTVEQTGSPKECALGKWLYSVGINEYGDIAEMGTLEATHRQFHERVRDVLALKGIGDQGQAERALSYVEPLSKKIVELLVVMEKKVSEAQNANIVVLRADDRQFGLVVDEINDTEEIVVKPLSKQLKSINTYAGATIMGDGKVALILDVLGLAQRAGVVSEVRDRAVTEKEGKQSLGAADGNQRNSVLLFQYGENGRMAIDLALVARLEEFPRDSVEVAADQEVVQYRGQIMPLVRVSEVLECKLRKAAENGQESLHVVVYADHGRSVGLVVDRILDIVEESFVMQRQTGRKGVLGSAVIQKRVSQSLACVMEQVRRELVAKIVSLGSRVRATPSLAMAPTRRKSAREQIDILAIGTSTGGPNALAEVVPRLPQDLPVPVVVVQHMPPSFTRLLAERLNSQSRLTVQETVQEAEAGRKLEPGQVWIARGDYHLTVARERTAVVLNLNQDPPENSCRPAVDALFRSVAQVYGPRVLGVVMTGMGSDGARGAAHIREAGGEILVQDEPSSVVWGMPGAVVSAGAADKICPLSEISQEIVRRVTASRRHVAGVPATLKM